MVEQSAFASETIGECTVVFVRGSEAMNSLPSIELGVLSADAEIDLEAAVGSIGLLTLGDGAGGVRSLDLLITDAQYAGAPPGGGHAYELTLSANTWLLTLRHGYRIFQRLSVHGIVSQVLQGAGVQDSQIEWRLAHQLHEREQCVQYDESDWSYIERLLADEGINYWFESDDAGLCKLIFGDSPQAHEPIDGEPTLEFEDGSGLAHTAASVFELTCNKQVGYESVHLRDYDYYKPDVLVEGKAGDGPLEHFEYPAWVPDADTAKRRAKVRLEQLQRHKRFAEASSHCVRLQPGRVVTIGGIADDDLNGHYLVESVTHALEQTTTMHSEGRQYVNQCRLIPQDGQTTYRPELPRNPPRVDGLETAIVRGAGGEEIDVDGLGRIIVSHPWDRSGLDDDKAGRRVRSMQMNMGASMLLPRVDWEVPIAYRDGCPDEPRCLGKVYNATATVPYPLPAKKATASLQSATTPGGGSTNEIRLTDDKGKQEMMVHASGHQQVNVGGNQTTEVSSKNTHNVGGNFNEHIVGAQSVSITASQTVGVGGPSSSKIKGARTIICGSEKIGVDKNRTVQSGPYIDLVGGLHFIRCNQHNEACAGSFIQSVGGLMGVTAGCGLNESVVGARIELCSARNVVTGSFEDKALAAKIITAGATSIIAGPIKTACKSAATVTAAATSWMAGGTLVISGTNVTINAASLARGSYTAAGSHTASAKVVHKGAKATHTSSTKAKS